MEISQKIMPLDIPQTNSGINYNIGQVPHHEKDLCISNLVKLGIIEEISLGRKDFFQSNYVSLQS